MIGIFVGFPRNQSGYLIWEPRSKTLRCSLDVSFDEAFTSHGPRRHFTFKDSLPVSLPDEAPIISAFHDTVPMDDHYGTPFFTPAERTFAEAFPKFASQPLPSFELYDDTFTTPYISDTLPLPTDPLSVEETLPDDSTNLEALNEQTVKPVESTAPNIVQTLDPLLVEDTTINDEQIYVDPLSSSRRSQRNRRPTKHFDESNLSEFVDDIIDTTPFHSLTMEALAAQAEFVAMLNDMEGYDPTDFLPEPQSLKNIKKLPIPIQKAWLQAYGSELKNLIGKKTFSHQKITRTKNVFRFKPYTKLN